MVGFPFWWLHHAFALPLPDLDPARYHNQKKSETMGHNQADGSDARVRAIILHMAARFQRIGKPLSITLLNKAFYYIDFGHFALHQHSVTAMKYKKDRYGPVPTELMYFVESLAQDDRLVAEQRAHTQAGSHYLSYSPSGQDVNLADYFDAQEIATIEKTIEAVATKTAAQLSQSSHAHVTWINTKRHDTIPLEDAQYCTFEWLGYYGKDKDAGDHYEAEVLREAFSYDAELKTLMNEATKSRKPIKIRGAQG